MSGDLTVSQSADRRPRSVRRDRSLEVEPLGDSRFAFTARLTDSSHGGCYDPPADSAVIHDFLVVGEVAGEELRLARLELQAASHPYPQCPFVFPACESLVGSAVGVGWRSTVLERLRGPAGCTHVTSLLLSLTEITTLIFFLKTNEEVPYGASTREDGTWMGIAMQQTPSLPGACHVLREDGPQIARARSKIRDYRTET